MVLEERSLEVALVLRLLCGDSDTLFCLPAGCKSRVRRCGAHRLLAPCASTRARGASLQQDAKRVAPQALEVGGDVALELVHAALGLGKNQLDLLKRLRA